MHRIAVLPFLFALGCASDKQNALSVHPQTASNDVWDGTEAAEDDGDRGMDDTGVATADVNPEDDGYGRPNDEDLATGGDADEPFGGLVPTHIRFDDESGDGLLQPGELASLEVTLRNDSDQDFGSNPGLVLSADSELVVLPEPCAWGWPLGAGEEVVLSFWILAVPDVGDGGDVLLTTTASAQDCGTADVPCPEPNALSMAVHVIPER